MGIIGSWVIFSWQRQVTSRLGQPVLGAVFAGAPRWEGRGTGKMMMGLGRGTAVPLKEQQFLLGKG